MMIKGKKRGKTMKSKILSVILIIMVAIFAMATAVNALSFTATMSTNSTTVPEATEFTVKIKVSNLDVGSNGINSLTGVLKYDSEVFESISESNVEGLNSWSATYDDSNGKIKLTKSMFVSSTQEVLSITFKTKAGVNGKKGSISLNDITASNSETDIPATAISTSITVGSGESGNTITAVTNGNNTTNSNALNTITVNPVANNASVGNTSNQARNNTTNNVANYANNNTANNTANNAAVSSYVNTMTNTTSDSDMPKTGVSDNLLFLAIGAIAVALMFYIKIEKLNKDIR